MNPVSRETGEGRWGPGFDQEGGGGAGRAGQLNLCVDTINHILWVVQPVRRRRSVRGGGGGGGKGRGAERVTNIFRSHRCRGLLCTRGARSRRYVP